MDDQGNLQPGDEGYVAPVVETPEVVTPEPVAEQPTPEAEPTTLLDPPTWAQYDALLNAYISLKKRVGLDAVYEKQLDAEAGLI